jgi:hypothetical protein
MGIRQLPSGAFQGCGSSIATSPTQPRTRPASRPRTPNRCCELPRWSVGVTPPWTKAAKLVRRAARGPTRQPRQGRRCLRCGRPPRPNCVDRRSSLASSRSRGSQRQDSTKCCRPARQPCCWECPGQPWSAGSRPAVSRSTGVAPTGASIATRSLPTSTRPSSRTIADRPDANPRQGWRSASSPDACIARRSSSSSGSRSQPTSSLDRHVATRVRQRARQRPVG